MVPVSAAAFSRGVWQRAGRKVRVVGWRGAVFSLAAVGGVAALNLDRPDSPEIAAGLTLAATTGLAAHTRLAFGRYAFVLVAAFAAVLVSGGAPSPAVWGAILTGVVVVALIGRCDQRACVLRAGFGVACAGAAASAVGTLMGTQPLEFAGVVAAAAGPFTGVALAIVAGPLFERVFGHVTRLTLNERLSYDHPLLQQLMALAPGTFQHSVNVGLLAHAGADAIGADALLARVGGLYHDVGKIRAPEFFIENQSGANPHDRLDPLASAQILRAHVLEGVEMVSAQHMGARLADFVREHHGTGVMRLLQAKAGAGADPGAFSYPGPAPRSPETGIVMLADQVEATARSSRPRDEAASLEVVQRTSTRIQQEGQLAASGLEGTDLTAVEAAMARAVHAMYHRRLRYPGQLPEGSGPSRPAADAP